MTQDYLDEYFNCDIKDNTTKIDIDSPDYPYLLKEIKKPPNPLYALGNLKIINKPAVAIVGSRKTTKDGRNAAEKITKYYGKNGFVIVSGLAQGVDSLAMKAALKINAPVIGVLPSSLDNVVPKKNERLADAILDKNGLLLSEYYENKSVRKFQYINRNRIISGLSFLVAVVETSIEGGTMHTVNFAKEQKRPIIVADIPTEGNQKLKEEGIPTIKL